MIMLNSKHVSLVLAVIAFCAVQLSFILNGVLVLDALALLLVPAFILFLKHLLGNFRKETWDFQWSLVVLFLCLAVFLCLRSAFEIAASDDNYHVKKLVGYAFQNSFASQWLHPFHINKGHIAEFEVRMIFIGFVESVWGIFWRLLRWDFIIVLLQALPLVVLWHELLHFFRKKNVPVAGVLALIIILTMQVLWVQQASGFIDSTTGVMGALALLGMYDVLSRRFQGLAWPRVLGLAAVSAMCLISKPFLMPLALAGIVVALVACRRLAAKAVVAVLMVVVLGCGYLMVHMNNVASLTGNPLFPLKGGDNIIFYSRPKNVGFNGMLETFYRANPLNVKIHNLGIDVPALFVLSSWMMDYKYRPWVSPDPWIGGRGLIWTYVVIPVLGLALFRRIDIGHPKVLIFVIIAGYILFMDGAILTRYALAIEIFIIAWALAWAWQFLEGAFPRRPAVQVAFVSLMAVFALMNYYATLDGDTLPKKHYPNTLCGYINEEYLKFIYNPKAFAQ